MTDPATATYGRAVLTSDDDVLISKATWPLRLSGLVFAGLLIIGRSASYGNVTWTPTYHPTASPLVVIHSGRPLPAAPKPLTFDPAAASKRSAADEVIAFSPGNAAGGEDGKSHGDGNHHSGGGDQHG